jgi:hypothetical protein
VDVLESSLLITNKTNAHQFAYVLQLTKSVLESFKRMPKSEAKIILETRKENITAKASKKINKKKSKRSKKMSLVFEK